MVITILAGIKLNRSTLIVQFVCVFIIILSYFTSKYLMIAAGVMCSLFLVNNVGWEQRYSLLYFLFPFTSIFAVSTGQTSMLMVIRIILILSVFIYQTDLVKSRLILYCIGLGGYCVLISLGNELRFMLRLSNILMWMLIIYFMQSVIHEKNSIAVSRSLSNGMLLSSLIGLFKESIPGLMNMILADGDITVSTDELIVASRFTGLFSDPNMYTILVISSLGVIQCELSKGNLSLTEYIIRTLATTTFGALTLSKSCILVMLLFWIYVIISNNSLKSLYKVAILSAVAVFVYYFMTYNSDWFNVMEYRFTKGNSRNVDLDTLTTGRYSIWIMYIEYLYQSGSFVLGNGLAFLLPKGRAAHNLILQCLYAMGVIGTFIYYKFFSYIYKTVPKDRKCVQVNKNGILMFVLLIATTFFLDVLYLEIFYYMISLCFIHMKETTIIVSPTLQ